MSAAASANSRTDSATDANTTGSVGGCQPAGKPPFVAIAKSDIVPDVKPKTGETADFLPLHKDTFDILVALADHDRHGYSIMQDIEARTNGRKRMNPSSLYTAIRRMLEDGLIEELDERPDPEHDDQRRRYYRITRFGRAVAIAEARRLERQLADARATGLVPKRL